MRTLNCHIRESGYPVNAEIAVDVCAVTQRLRLLDRPVKPDDDRKWPDDDAKVPDDNG
jgi:hypothetical protein